MSVGLTERERENDVGYQSFERRVKLRHELHVDYFRCIFSFAIHIRLLKFSKRWLHTRKNKKKGDKTRVLINQHRLKIPIQQSFYLSIHKKKMLDSTQMRKRDRAPKVERTRNWVIGFFSLLKLPSSIQLKHVSNKIWFF